MFQAQGMYAGPALFDRDMARFAMALFGVLLLLLVWIRSNRDRAGHR